MKNELDFKSPLVWASLAILAILILWVCRILVSVAAALTTWMLSLTSYLIWFLLAVGCAYWIINKIKGWYTIKFNK